jgi:enterochelin esterase family protein
MWILDPLNSQQAIGGYGPNSEIWMPDYVPPKEITYRAEIPHGRLDSMSIKSKLLKRTHPVFVYTPPGYKASRDPCPAIYVTDGGEYITLALMLNVLDNLIEDKRIEPVVAIFIDPRTNISDSQTSARMYDYTMKDVFVSFLADEVRNKVLKKYRITHDPHLTAIMGASLGGLTATYTAYTRPDIFGLCAAQSPAYWWNDEAMINTIANGPKKQIKLYIDTGTIRDAKVQARKMKSVLEDKGYEFSYAEYAEGHNWSNWRARIDDILVYFYGTHR